MVNINKRNKSHITLCDNLCDSKNWYKSEKVEKYSIKKTLLIEQNWTKSHTRNNKHLQRKKVFK